MNNKLEKILTKSAKEELDKYLSEEKDRILYDAYNRASRLRNDVQEISLRDIIDAKDSKLLKDSRIKRSEYKRKKMTTLLAMSGVFYTIIGFLFYLYQNSKFDLENNLGLIIAVIGILVTFMAFFYNQMYFLKSKIDYERNESEKYSTDSEFSVVERWAIIEKLLRDQIEKESNEKPKSFNQILSYLDKNKSFSDKEKLELRELLRLRNNILHESTSIPNSKIKEYVELADELINKLEK